MGLQGESLGVFIPGNKDIVSWKPYTDSSIGSYPVSWYYITLPNMGNDASTNGSFALDLSSMTKVLCFLSEVVCSF